MGSEANQPAFLAPASFSAAIAALQFRSGATVSGGLDRKRVAHIQPGPLLWPCQGQCSRGHCPHMRNDGELSIPHPDTNWAGKAVSHALASSPVQTRAPVHKVPALAQLLYCSKTTATQR